MQVIVLDPKEEERWKERARSVWKDFIKTPEMKSLSDKAQAIIAAMPKQ